MQVWWKIAGMWVAGVGFTLLNSAGQEVTSPASDLNSSGQVTVDGHLTPYLIRHLPVNAFPQLPPAIQDALTRRGCLVPQTYEAHQPENVVNASFERHGSSDWAVLCSVDGRVSLLVFFANRGDPMVSGHGAGDRSPRGPRLKPGSRIQLGHRSRITRCGAPGATRHESSAAAPRP